MKTARQLNIEHLVHVRDSTKSWQLGTHYDTAPLLDVMHLWIAKKYDFAPLQLVMSTWAGDEFSPYVSMNS